MTTETHDLTAIVADFAPSFHRFSDQLHQWCEDKGTTPAEVRDQVTELLRESPGPVVDNLTPEQRVRRVADSLGIRGRARARFISSRS